MKLLILFVLCASELIPVESSTTTMRPSASQTSTTMLNTNIVSISTTRRLPVTMSTTTHTDIVSTTRPPLNSVSATRDMQAIMSTTRDMQPFISSTKDMPPTVSTTNNMQHFLSTTKNMPPIMSTTKNMQPTLSTTRTMLPIISTTVNMPTLGTCKPGFVQCTDGACEPFELLCGDGGIVTLPTLKPEPTTSATRPTVSSTMGRSTGSFMSQASLIPGNTIMSTPMPVVTILPQTGGVCQLGFVQCTDGRCEPFEQLCDGGTVTLPTVKPEMTTSTTSPLVTNSNSVHITSPSGPPASTIPTTIMTLKPLDNGCAPGFELCPDKKCEPFHFMCDEHLNSELVGR